MIGVYNYTVLLTYFSMLSAGTGIVVALSGDGHPYIGMFFLLFCGLLDAFDGKVARTKADRTEMECNFGIQIDSLCDVVAFGVLPACIGVAMLRRSTFLEGLERINEGPIYFRIISFMLYSVLILYILAALIRLAYFNVTEEERQKTEGGVRTYYTGLPVTAASLIFPLALLIDYVVPIDMTLLYFGFIVFTGFAFLSKFQVRKPKLKGILILIGLGVVEIFAFAVCVYFVRK